MFTAGKADCVSLVSDGDGQATRVAAFLYYCGNKQTAAMPSTSILLTLLYSIGCRQGRLCHAGVWWG